MKHLGDITQIKGNEVPVVDCVIGGSPCQGLSQAGKRAGLDDKEYDILPGQMDIFDFVEDEDE